VRDDEAGLMTLVGPLWQRGEGGDLRFGFRAEEKHLNRRGVVHGGMVMTFADQALGLAAREINGGLPQATIQLDTQFIAPVEVDDFVEVSPQLVRRTRSILFMRGTLLVGERTVASAQGIWKVIGAGKGSASQSV
jgi:acyl-coenzyme A thioesterase PaaI-like protein